MSKRTLILVLAASFLIGVNCTADVIPSSIGPFRIEVTGPGNDFHDEDEDSKGPSSGHKNITEKGPKDKRQFARYLRDTLGNYRNRFNFADNIKDLGKGPADGAFRFVVLGDSRSDYRTYSHIVKHIDKLQPRPAFAINTGDTVYNGYAKQLREYYVKATRETDIPFFVTLGNHDDGRDDDAAEFRYLFGKDSLNYYFDYGKSRFIFVDTATDVIDEDDTFDFLDKTLKDTPKGYLQFVSTHKPPKVIDKWAYHAWGTDESKKFTALMTEHKVEQVFLGHIHAYSTAKYKGIDYAITGGGGASLHMRFGPKGSRHQYLICDVQPNGTVKQKSVQFQDTEN